MADTGPPYPPLPGYRSNAIGRFQIGVSPIGDIPYFSWTAAVISQYANSPILDALIASFSAAADQTANIDAFYDLIFNVYTAQGYGLDVWGRIVGINRVVHVVTVNWFGFAEALPNSSPFNTDAFYSGAPLTQNYSLSDQAYRLLILAKAMSNITDGSIPSINRILMSLFPNRGNAYVTEGANLGEWFGFAESINAWGFNQAPFYSGSALPTMVMTYTFDFALSPVELAIVQGSGVLPKPVGVLATVVQNA